MAKSERNTAETEPLLREGRRNRSSREIDDRNSEAAAAAAAAASASPSGKRNWTLPKFTTISPRYKWVPLLGCAIVFINEAEYFVKQVATMRAIESMHCYEFYKARDSPLVELGKHIPERLCKDDLIQKQLARTAGLIMFFRMSAAMIGAIPLGWLADRYGRKIVLVLHKVNVTCACLAWFLVYIGFPKVPIWTLYLSGLFGLFGGNFDIGLAMLFAAFTDVIPSASERATLFFLTTSMQFLAQAFCPTIGAFLMNLDGKGSTPQVNLAVSLVMATCTALLTIFAFPETVQESKKSEPQPESESERASDHSNQTSPKSMEAWLSRKWQITYKVLLASISGVGVLNIILLACSIFFAATGVKSIDWYAMVQYPVVKLGWTFSQASYIVTLEGILMLVHFSVFLPLLSKLAVSHLGSSGAGHFAIMAASASLLIIGSILIGFSATTWTFVCGIIVYMFGTGLPTATQAYIVSLIDGSKVARVMALLSTASIGGKLLASLLFPKVLAIGLDTHVEILVGLPFFACAVLFAIAALCLAAVGLRVKSETNGNKIVDAESV